MNSKGVVRACLNRKRTGTTAGVLLVSTVMFGFFNTDGHWWFQKVRWQARQGGHA